MTQFQKFLLLVFAVLAVAVVGRVAWTLILPGITLGVRGVASLFGALPGWAWWVVFGVAMSFLCSKKGASFGCGRRSSLRCSSRRSTANV